MLNFRACKLNDTDYPVWSRILDFIFPISCLSWIVFLCIHRDHDYEKICKLLICSVAGVIGILLVSGFFGQNFDERMSAILMGNFFYWPAAVWHIYLAHNLTKKYPS